MSENLKLAVIGTESSILLYKAVGAETHPVASVDEAKKALEHLANQMRDEELGLAEYAVVFVEENFYKDLPEDLLERLMKRPLPAVVPVPSPDSGSEQYGIKRLSKIVEKAIGSDILG